MTERFEIIEVLSNLEDLEVWKWENLLEALDKIAGIVGYETEQLGKEYTGSYEEDIEQLQKEYDELAEEKEQLKQIIYEDESQIIGEWSSHIQEDMKELNEAYESDDINDLIRFCKEG